jgi:hypothetical protein
MFSPECSFKIDFWGKLRLKLFIPIILLVSSWLMHLGMLTFKSAKEQNLDGKELRSNMKYVVGTFSNSFLKVVLLLFTLEATTIFSIFDCAQVSPGKYILRREPSSKCYDSFWVSRALEVLAFSILYFIIFPWRLSQTLYQMRKDPTKMNDPKNRHLITGFKRRFYWWDVVIVFKRLVFGMLSQFFFSSASSLKTVTVLIFLFMFFAVDVLVEPYQRGNMTKHSWNFAAILLLLCQTFVFDGENDFGNIFLIMCFGLLVFCLVSSMYHVLIELKNRKKVFIDKYAYDQLKEETQRDVYVIHGETKLAASGEFGVDLDRVSRWNQGDVSVQTIWQARRLCDVYYDSGFISPKFAVLADKLDVTRMSTMQVLVSPTKFLLKLDSNDRSFNQTF